MFRSSFRGRRPIAKLQVLYRIASRFATYGYVRLADLIFALDLPVRCSDGRSTSTRILRVPQTRTSEPRQERRPFTRRVEFLGEISPSAPLYFVSSDSRYALRYAAPVAASLSRSAPAFGMHVHLVNPTAAALRLTKRMAAEHERCSISVETTDLSAFSDQEQRTYYACARFLLMPALLRKCVAPIICADIDQLVIGPLDELLDLIDNTADVALLRYDHRWHNILAYFSATVLALSHTSEARRFAQQLADNLIDLIERPDHLKWHLDQAALAMTQIATRGPRYAFISPQLVRSSAQTAASPAAILWSITHSLEDDPDAALGVAAHQ